MELTIHEAPVEYLQRTVLDTIYQEQTAEIIVPDSMPDIDRIIDSYGTIILQDKRCEDGELRISGGIQAGVLYLPEGMTEVQQLEAWLPFSIRKNADTHDGCLIERSWLKSIDARAVNSRKALIRANLGVQLTEFSPDQFQLAVVEPTPSLQTRQNTYPILLPVGCGEQEFRVQDELTLPEEGPAMERILRWEVHPSVEESRMIGTKAVFKGDLVVEVLFLGTDGSINTFVGQLPFSQYAELNGEWPDSTVVVFPAVTSAQIETDGQMESRTLLVDISLLAQVCVIDQFFVDLTEDAYAIGGTLQPVWQEVSLHPQLDSQTLRQTAELSIPVKASKIVNVSVYADKPVLRRNQDSVYATTALSGNAVYVDSDGELRAKSLRGECVGTAAVHENCRVLPSCRLSEHPKATVQSDSILITVPVEFNLEILQDSSWQNLAGGEITPEERRSHPSVIVRRWQGGDLWSIAKQLGATVDDIKSANGMEGNKAPEGDILLIPMR